MRKKPCSLSGIRQSCSNCRVYGYSGDTWSNLLRTRVLQHYERYVCSLFRSPSYPWSVMEYTSYKHLDASLMVYTFLRLRCSMYLRLTEQINYRYYIVGYKGPDVPML